MPFVRVMEVAINKVVNMIAMRNGFVSALFSMNMTGVMTAAAMSTAAIETMLVDMIAMLMMKVSIMEIIDVIAVRHSRVTTCARMLMIMMIVCLAVTH